VTAATSPPPAPPADRPRSGLWTLILVMGFIVAVLGVNAAIASVQRKQYFETRATALYLLRNGNAINTSIQRLQEVNARDYNLLKDTQIALDAGNTSLVNRLVGQADVFGVEQHSLQQAVQVYKAEFDKASQR
jgi:hypothetical protein